MSSSSVSSPSLPSRRKKRPVKPKRPYALFLAVIALALLPILTRKYVSYSDEVLAIAEERDIYIGMDPQATVPDATDDNRWKTNVRSSLKLELAHQDPEQTKRENELAQAMLKKIPQDTKSHAGLAASDIPSAFTALDSLALSGRIADECRLMPAVAMAVSLHGDKEDTDRLIRRVKNHYLRLSFLLLSRRNFGEARLFAYTAAETLRVMDAPPADDDLTSLFSEAFLLEALLHRPNVLSLPTEDLDALSIWIAERGEYPKLYSKHPIALDFTDYFEGLAGRSEESLSTVRARYASILQRSESLRMKDLARLMMARALFWKVHDAREKGLPKAEYDELARNVRPELYSLLKEMDASSIKTDIGFYISELDFW